MSARPAPARWRSEADGTCYEERRAEVGDVALTIRRSRRQPEHPWSRWTVTAYQRPWLAEHVRGFRAEQAARNAAVAFARRLARGAS